MSTFNSNTELAVIDCGKHWTCDAFSDCKQCWLWTVFFVPVLCGKHEEANAACEGYLSPAAWNGIQRTVTREAMAKSASVVI